MSVDVEAYYRRYAPMVLRRCRRLLRDEQEAADAMQDVFVQVLRRKETLEDQAPSSLLYRVATNVCLNRLRTRSRRPEDPHQEKVMLLARESAREEQGLSRVLLARIFGREPESTAVIAALHFVDGMTYEEVASEVGMSVSGVRKRLRVLKERLQADGEDASV